MEFILQARYERFAQIAQLFVEGHRNLLIFVRAGFAVRGVCRLSRDVGIADTLRCCGITGEDLSELAATAVKNFPDHLESNPRQVTYDDAIEIYRKAL
jgi:alcohol dehydrogenase class IV